MMTHQLTNLDSSWELSIKEMQNTCRLCSKKITLPFIFCPASEKPVHVDCDKKDKLCIFAIVDPGQSHEHFNVVTLK